MKKNYLLILVFILPFMAKAQRGYYSVGLNSSYQLAVFSTGIHYRIDEGATLIAGIEGEKYFKSGLKVSLGFGLGYFGYKSDMVLIENDPSQGFYRRKNTSYSYLIPLTIGYNLLPKKGNIQLFAFTGYSFSAYFYSKTKIYNSLANPQEQTYINEATTPFRQLSFGLDARYIIKNKFYTGVAISFSDRHYTNNYRMLSQIFSAAGVKAGFLF